MDSLQSLSGFNANDGVDPGTGAASLSVTTVALASTVLLLNVGVSMQQGLGLHSQLIISGCRMLLQLSVLGYVLVPIFTTKHWYVVAAYMAFMMVLAGMEACQRPRHSFKGQFLIVLAAMSISGCCLLAFTLLVLLRLEPKWWEPQYAIPILGMILGNSTSAVSVGLSTVLEEFATRKEHIELMLAFGATRREACTDVVRRALRTATLPLVNQMAVIGLVSIPGMMTGQILAGTDPSQAARYQMVIMLVLGAASCLSAMVVVYLAVGRMVDGCHTLRLERLESKKTVVQAWKLRWSRAAKVMRRVGACCATCFCCMRPTSALPSSHHKTGGNQKGAMPVQGDATTPLLLVVSTPGEDSNHHALTEGGLVDTAADVKDGSSYSDEDDAQSDAQVSIAPPHSTAEASAAQHVAAPAVTSLPGLVGSLVAWARGAPRAAAAPCDESSSGSSSNNNSSAARQQQQVQGGDGLHVPLLTAEGGGSDGVHDSTRRQQQEERDGVDGGSTGISGSVRGHSMGVGDEDEFKDCEGANSLTDAAGASSSSSAAWSGGGVQQRGASPPSGVGGSSSSSSSGTWGNRSSSAARS